MTDSPLVSVILPTYNSGDLLSKAVASILVDGDVDVELLVIDDGSDDGSVERLAATVHDKRLRVVNRGHHGLAGALNIGVQEARAPFIARMDADDESLPGRLAAQVRFLESHPAVSLVGGQIVRVSGRIRSESHFPLGHREIVDGLLRGQHVLCHPAVMFRRQVALSTDGYWDAGVAEDWDFYLQMAEKGALANLPSTVLEYRFHDSGINAANLYQVRRNIELANHNYRRRRRGLSSQQVGGGASLPLVSRIRVAQQYSSLNQYRKALLAQRSGRWTEYATRIAIAAVLWPAQAFRRLGNAAFHR